MNKTLAKLGGDVVILSPKQFGQRTWTIARVENGQHYADNLATNSLELYPPRRVLGHTQDEPQPKE